MCFELSTGLFPRARIFVADSGFKGRLKIIHAGARRVAKVPARYVFTRYLAKRRAAQDFLARREYLGRAKTAMGTV